MMGIEPVWIQKFSRWRRGGEGGELFGGVGPTDSSDGFFSVISLFTEGVQLLLDEGGSIPVLLRKPLTTCNVCMRGV